MVLINNDESQVCFLKYWVQISFFLIAIGYWVKSFFELWLKKKEINYARITENKISELKSYINAYNELVFTLKEVYFLAGQNKLADNKEIGAKLSTNWLKFISCYSTLRIFINEKDFGLYEEIKQELEEIQKMIIENQIDKSFGIVSKEDLDKLLDIGKKKFPERLPNLINKIEISIKEEIGI